MDILVWLLVGIVRYDPGAPSGPIGFVAPPQVAFASLESCEEVKRAIQEITNRSSLRCVKATIKRQT